MNAPPSPSAAPARSAKLLRRGLPAALVTKGGKQLGPWAYALLVLVSLAFFLPGLTSLPPSDRDEPRFAQTSKQMLESGNLVDLRFQDEPRYRKPVGIYWLQAASARLLSPHNLNTIAAYRVPSLIGATVAVVMTAALGSLLFGPLVGFLAALLLAACPLMNVEARLAKTDAVLLACHLVSLYVLALAWRARPQGATEQHALAPPGPVAAGTFWTAQAIAFLVKGPIVVLITAALLFTLRLRGDRLIWLRHLRPVWGIPWALALVVPWFIGIALVSHGQFFAASGGHDFLAKLWQGQDRGIVPPGLHTLVFPALFFPGSLLAFLAVRHIVRARAVPEVGFGLAGIILPWIVFELALTKLPHYVLPTYPLLAILVVEGALAADAKTRARWEVPLGVVILSVIGIGLAVLLAVLPLVVRESGQGLPGIQIAAGALLLVGLGVGIARALIARDIPKAIFALVAGSLVFMAVTFGLTLPSLTALWPSQAVTRLADSVKPCADLDLVTGGYGEPSLVFQAGTQTRLFADGAAVAHALRVDRCALGVVIQREEPAFLAVFQAADDPPPVALGHVHGFSLGRGKNVDLTLYRWQNPASEAP